MRSSLESTLLLTVAALLMATVLLPSPPYVTALPRSARQAPVAEDTWGPWSSEWSPCSRSCGGGVSYQERRCITTRPGAKPTCMGPAFNYRSCNIQDCPEGAQDFREEQCSKYNTKEFLGNFYNWVPYLGADNKCELNCMPKGKNFYYRLAEKVVDGTRCEADKLDVCVNGECMKVGCDNMLGSDAREDICRECNGNGSSCKTISGAFGRKKLPFGYNDILVLPAGAVNIHVAEVQPSNNFLALRNANGQYYINGNFTIDFPQPFEVADTVVYYERKFGAPFYGAEALRALGPITEPLFVVLVTQERNHGVAYNYSVPLDSEGAKPDTYSWLFSDFTPCTRTCGGGYQLRDVWCARSSDFVRVPEYLCDPALKPAGNHSCNMVPCPPSWLAGEWSPCSTSCGLGQQVRLVYCEQVMHGDRAEIIHDSFCENGLLEDKPSYQQHCFSAPCPEWTAGNWSQCSVTCGRGVQTRAVSCSSGEEVLADSQCLADIRPNSQQVCHMGPCEDVQWLVSQWSDCSDQCGDGVQTRQVHCMGPSGTIYAEDVCDGNLRPATTQRCSSRQACHPLWHASRWTECSTDCGQGLRIRNVFCAHFVNGEWEATSDGACNATIKLSTSEVCDNGPCVGAVWLTGSWEKCSAKCEGGQRARQIMCFKDGTSLDSSHCDASNRPIEQEICNTQPCDGSEEDCNRSTYGCCEDGVTEATGPDQEGCPTSETEAPTSAPSTTTGPTCASSTFGCCADGINAASGPDGEGCQEEKETCEQPYDTGPCYAFELKWFFDIEYQRCVNFWYGGCEGNANRFDSEKECQSVCTIQQEPMTQEEMCSLPPEVGPCKKSIESYYFNPETGQCESFTYGGCHGNMNKFRTPEECDIKCGTLNKDPCTLPLEHGNCFETHLRWFYNIRTQQCEQFNYTGCLGNPNRFEDAASCEERCGVVDRVPDQPETTGVVVDVCGLPKEHGPCRESILQWYYDTERNSCQQFIYGGCLGNANRFDSRVTCSQACISYGAEQCSLPIEPGPCFGYFPTWGYNATVGACQPFVYGGCQGNDNRFDTQDACDHACGPKAITKCRRSRNYATYVAQGRLGAFIPQCTLEGHFEAMQCHGSTGHCWCVDMNGREINGSRRAPGIHVQRPDCEAFQPRTLTTCQRHLKQVQGKNGQAPPGRYVPQCTEAGEYETVQCYGSTGYCWCVNVNGEEIDGTRRGPGMGSPNCDGGAQGPCPSLALQLQAGQATNDYQPVCTPDGLFVRVQCDGVPQCLCVNETTGEVLKVLNEVPLDGDFDACNDAHQEPTRCQQHRNSVLATEEPTGHIRYVPECNEAGDYREIQCYGNTGHCWCVNDNGEEIDGTRKRPGEGVPDCTVKDCHAAREEASSSGRIGHYIPQCTEEGLYTPTQCHGGTGYCWCVDENGEELTGTRRGPGDEPVNCEDVCSLPKVTGPCRGYFPVFGYDAMMGSCDKFIYGGCQGNANRFQTREACLIACTDYQPQPTTVLPPYTTQSVSPTESPDERSTVSSPTSSPPVSSTAETPSTAPSAPPRAPSTPSVASTAAPRVTASSSPASRSTTTAPSTTTPASTTLSVDPTAAVTERQSPSPLPDSTGSGQPSTTPQTTTLISSMCEIQRKEALANTLPGVFIPQCQEDGSFVPKQCYELIGQCWCVHQDGVEQGGTRALINEPLDCQDICSMPEFRGQCPDNIQKWYFNTEAGVCETFTYSGCQGNLNQFDDQATCEQTCVTPEPTSCPEKRKTALARGLLGEFVPQCTEDGLYASKQCHSSIGHCWCVDEEGMELGATRRGPGEEMLDCDDACSLPKFSGPCKGSSAMWYYDVITERCKPFNYGGCQGNGNRFETEAECQTTCYIPEVTGRPPTTCEIQREEALTSPRLDAFIPQCTSDGAFEARQCYDLISQCWCVNENGEAQGGTRTRRGQVPLDCNDKCSFPKFVGPCRGNFPKWFYNMETMSCEEFTYGGCGGNMNQFNSQEECQQACLPQGPEMQSCQMQREEALANVRPGQYVPRCTEDGWFMPQQCHESTGQCWCVTETGMEQGETRREPGMPLLDCEDVCSFPQATGPCLGYFAMWYYDTEEQACRRFIYGGCQGNGNRFESRAECEQSCVVQVTTTSEPVSLCLVTRQNAQSQNVIGNFIPQCTEEGLFVRRQCHGSTGYCWCVDEMTGEEIVTRVPKDPRARPDCDVYYRNDTVRIGEPSNTTQPTDRVTLSPSHPLGDEGCATSTFGCCPDGVTQASREDHLGCPGITPAMVEVAPSDSTVVLGGTLTIACRAQGSPTPTVTWHREDANVEDGRDSRISVSEDGTLVIEDVVEADSGLYVCRASNGVGQAAKVAVDVNVFTPVQIPETSQLSVRAKEGDVVELHCRATGNPKPVVTWERGVVFLPDNDPRMSQLEDDTLRIENVELGDSGNYVCTGRNMFGTVQKKTITLTVEAEVHIVNIPYDVTAEVGATVRLACGSTGSPKPTTRWTVNNVGLPPMDRFELLPTGDLIINGLRSTDGGTYTCTAANGISSESASATVTVQGAAVDPNCQDNVRYANCRVVLRANFCHRKPYDTYCCATCKDSQVRGRRRRR
ncbi:papilin-like [Acanthaster planci]|uniref:Papilin n=1 Tax=Acanthaster planci TaxID=133434 RepID=A0A8B7YR36_ACAPL|nr:papilin-like [Acanthaster planci]